MPDYPTPATPTSISLEVRRGSPSYYPRRVGIPYIHRRCFLLTPDTPPNIGWPVQIGHTIHLNNKLHGYPSPDILSNHLLIEYIIIYILSYKYVAQTRNNSQFRQFLITHFKNSTTLVEHPRQTDELSTCHRLARHYRGANLQLHAVAQTTHIRPLRTTTTILYPRHYNPQVQRYKRFDRYIHIHD